ncbi:MAG TPA: hypothetical protein VL947_06150, partial [Cytophagales bacterium]|nr:hypothetical protein [Cytophagales bacterium]
MAISNTNHSARLRKVWSTWEQGPIISYLIKWSLITSIIGIAVGSASALFLISLDYVTQLRDQHLWLIALLPLG